MCQSEEDKAPGGGAPGTSARCEHEAAFRGDGDVVTILSRRLPSERRATGAAAPAAETMARALGHRRPGLPKRLMVMTICLVAAIIGVTCGSWGRGFGFWWAHLLEQGDTSDASKAEDRERRAWYHSIEGISRKLQGDKDRRKRNSAQKELERNRRRQARDDRRQRLQQERQREKYDKWSRRVSAKIAGLQRDPRKALRSLWRRLKHGADGGRSSNAKPWTETDMRARVLHEFREAVDRHPGDLWRRAKQVEYELDDAMLARYLDTVGWTLQAGGEQLTDAVDRTLRWREEAQPHLITDRDVMDEGRDGKAYVRGHDREGRPIIFYTPARERNFDTEKGLQLVYYTLEKATALLPRGQEQFAVIADCAGFGASKMPPLAMVKGAFLIMQQHYPMRLGYVIIVNANGPVNLMWKVLSSVLHDRTKDKIIFVTNKEAARALSARIQPSVLPSSLPGGLDSFVYGHDQYLSS